MKPLTNRVGMREGPVPVATSNSNGKRVRQLIAVAFCFAFTGFTCFAQSLPSSNGSADHLLLPSGAAYDAAGNLYVADALRNQVIELTPGGVVTVLAGTGDQGFAGDGGSASLALLNSPLSVAIGKDGTVYIADSGNQRIRAISAGQIQTIAGTGAKGYSGDGGAASLAALSGPAALAVDDNNRLLIADGGNHRIRRVDAGIISTVAGTGVQGFDGDGSAATSAQLDSPAGIAVGSDGRIFISDSHNHRIRVIDKAGVIRTFAGNGLRGYDGDSQPAISSKLLLPRGIVIAPSGAVIFADSDNHRVRSVDTQGIITTLVGDGVQGRYADGDAASRASLDTPRMITLQDATHPTFSDSRSRVISQIAADQDLYTLLPILIRPAAVTITSSGTYVYGEGNVSVSVASPAPTAYGVVTLLDGANSVTSANLSNGSIPLSVASLASGAHALSAQYSGDGLHPAAMSATITIAVQPRELTAVAAAATMAYGAATPSLSGTLTGALSQDNGKVSATFSVNAPDLSPVGTYPIAATLSGSASPNYTLKIGAGSGSLQIVPAVASVTMQQAITAYAGMPVVLKALVTTTTRGAPTGSVDFLDSGTVVATGAVTNGSATGVMLNTASGTHTISAMYSGDKNFLSANSASSAITVSAMPDYTFTQVGDGKQTVQGGSIATYNLQVSAQPAPFSGSVSFSVSGLPVGAKASFSPAVVVPGNASVPIVLTIQTVTVADITQPRSVWKPTTLAAFLGVVIVTATRRRRVLGLVICALLVAGVGVMEGCGARSVVSHSGQDYIVTLTATSTNLAGAVVVHTTSVSLTVQ